jgi:hypothetical protein
VTSGLKRSWIRGDVDRVLLQSFERDDLESSLVRGCENDIGCRAVYVRLEPVGCGHTPAIAGHQPGKAILRHWRDQVVADLLLMLEKLGGDHGADRVAAKVLGAGIAATVAKEPGDRIGATCVERSAEDVEVGHDPSIALAPAYED